MKFTKDDLNLENGIKREWLLSNGIGGYSSSTIIGLNTRKYHGLLVASLAPPAKRHLILSKIDESIQIDNKYCNLYNNMCINYVSDGYKYLEKFEKNLLPKFTYTFKDIIIEKTICMPNLENTVFIKYDIKTGKDDIKLKLAPVINFKDFHVMKTDENFDIKQESTERKCKIEINNSGFPIYLYSSEGDYIEHKEDVFKNMYYLEEEKRGFLPQENHIVPGVYEIKIPRKSNKTINLICSLNKNIETINVENAIKREVERLEKLTENEDEEYIKQLLLSADSFIVYRPTFKLHSLIAGYPWFLDWGRDTLISFEGVFLVTKRFELAKEILLTMTHDIKFGLVPNGYSENDNSPLYNSADSSLLLFEQVKKYLTYTGDYEFIKENLYDKLKEIVYSYSNGVDFDNNNIYVDKDGLLVSGTENTQNTWMDAKIGDFVVTPRNGKAVEINALWYNALIILKELSEIWNDENTAVYCSKLAKTCKKSFNSKFYNEEKESLFDVLGDDKIRPNQIFAFSLTYPIIELNSEIAIKVFNTITKKLLMKHGLKSLAKGEKNYIEVYSGDNFKRDMSYHQGITWTWLIGAYYDGLKNMIKFQKNKRNKEELEKQLNKLIENTKKTFKNEVMNNACVGSVSEIYDSISPYLSKGAFSQAWSVAEIIRIVKEL